MSPKPSKTPSRLECDECGAAARVVQGRVVRECAHDGKVIAHLHATAYGQGAMAS